MKKIIYSISALFFAMPAIAGAATTGPDAGIIGLFNIANKILGYLVPFIISIAVVLFLWGVIKYIRSAGDPEKEKEARGTMIYGIIGIFVMVSVWGFVRVLQSTLGFNDTTKPPTGPGIPTGTGN